MKKLLQSLSSLWKEDPLRYWEKRARKHGVRSVLNLGHSREEVDAVTEWQKGILFPMLKAELAGGETTLLDFGCGPGRFTGGLAQLIGGQAVGVDPIQHLLDIAPAAPATEYRVSRDGRIPLADGSVDVIWCCLVLGGIAEDALPATVAEFARVLKPGGLLFLVENTAEKPDSKHWQFRSLGWYQQLFPYIALRQLGDYEDLGERISVLAGRRR